MADTSIEISVKGKWVRVPALTVNGTTIVVRGRWVRMAIIHDEEWLVSELEEPEVCIRTLKEQKSPGLRADIFTFAQKLPNTIPKYPYPVEWDGVAAITLSSFKDWWEQRLPQETRKNVRRSLKRGVVISLRELDDNLIKGIVELNNDSPVRQGVPFVHYRKTYDQVKRDQSSFLDRSDFICAYLGNELIGLLKLVYRGDVASILQLLSKGSHYDKRPGNALIAKAVERCEQKGVSYVTYGKYRYGNQERTSLLEFKMRNGFEEILVPRFYVPLTNKGKVAMTLKLHRDLVALLPESAIHFGRNLRAKWYTLRTSSGRRSSMVEWPKL